MCLEHANREDFPPFSCGTSTTDGSFVVRFPLEDYPFPYSFCLFNQWHELSSPHPCSCWHDQLMPWEKHVPVWDLFSQLSLWPKTARQCTQRVFFASSSLFFEEKHAFVHFRQWQIYPCARNCLCCWHGSVIVDGASATACNPIFFTWKPQPSYCGVSRDWYYIYTYTYM